MYSLKEQFLKAPYQSYLYSYPHKTAYRKLNALPLGQIWENEKKGNLFLYLHIPFCFSRCAFCNLMSHTGSTPALVEDYIQAVLDEAKAVRAELGPIGLSGFAIGGGTPNVLDRKQLYKVVTRLENIFSFTAGSRDTSFEVSPLALTPEQAGFYAALGINRISVGIQSFKEQELKNLGRAADLKGINKTLDALKTAEGKILLNIDLIYGIPGQDTASFLYSLEKALKFGPDQLFLYPLYRRPYTGLYKQAPGNDSRLELYRAGRELLLASGYRQDSMRKFIKVPNKQQEKQQKENDQHINAGFCCQEDGMIGLGCGARSYTRDIHYSKEYAVSPPAIKKIVKTYLKAEHRLVSYGFALNEEEQKRRYVIKSILKTSGLSPRDYSNRFGIPDSTSPPAGFPQLEELHRTALLEKREDRLVLTPAGLELSDAIGPYLISPAVRRLMEDFDYL